MAETEQTKVCPLCAEIIKTAAKVCPFCRSKQVRHALWRQELTLAVPALALIILAIVVIASLVPDENGVGGRSFAGHRKELIVLNTSLARDQVKPAFWLTGVVTNQGEFPWRVQQLEVRFLDERGNLLDVRNSDVENPFVVQSRQEHGFKVELRGLAFTNSSITQQVRVEVATDGDRRLKSD